MDQNTDTNWEEYCKALPGKHFEQTICYLATFMLTCCKSYVMLTSSINTCHIANTGELDVFGLLSGGVGILLIV